MTDTIRAARAFLASPRPGMLFDVEQAQLALGARFMGTVKDRTPRRRRTAPRPQLSAVPAFAPPPAGRSLLSLSANLGLD